MTASRTDSPRSALGHSEVADSRWPGLRRIIHTVLPRHAYAALRFELHMARVRLASRRTAARFANARDLLVNVAAGDQGRAGWINVDGFSRPGVNCIYDCRKGLPFPDGSARAIFCEHFFEHLEYFEEAPQFLLDCHRVLASGGVLRIIVPDAERYLRAYCDGGWEALQKIRPLHDGRKDGYTGVAYRTRIELINWIFRQGQEHKFAYDYETLELALRAAGFARVVKQSFGCSLLPELCLDQQVRASESLYVEGQKAE